jgi:hypothetical protein
MPAIVTPVVRCAVVTPRWPADRLDQSTAASAATRIASAIVTDAIVTDASVTAPAIATAPVASARPPPPRVRAGGTPAGQQDDRGDDGQGREPEQFDVRGGTKTAEEVVERGPYGLAVGQTGGVGQLDLTDGAPLGEGQGDPQQQEDGPAGEG